jgi:hypothetical protein
MNKYKVKVTHLFSEVIDVEAETEEGARESAIQELQKEDRQIGPSYETTLPPEHWAVITAEKFEEMLKEFESKLNKEEPSNIITPSIITP